MSVGWSEWCTEPRPDRYGVAYKGFSCPPTAGNPRLIPCRNLALVDRLQAARPQPAGLWMRSVEAGSLANLFAGGGVGGGQIHRHSWGIGL